MKKNNLISFNLFSKCPTLSDFSGYFFLDRFGFIEVVILQHFGPFDEKKCKMMFTSVDDFKEFVFNNCKFYVKAVYTFLDLELFEHIVFEII